MVILNECGTCEGPRGLEILRWDYPSSQSPGIVVDNRQSVEYAGWRSGSFGSINDVRTGYLGELIVTTPTFTDVDYPLNGAGGIVELEFFWSCSPITSQFEATPGAPEIYPRLRVASDGPGSVFVLDESTLTKSPRVLVEVLNENGDVVATLFDEDGLGTQFNYLTYGSTTSIIGYEAGAPVPSQARQVVGAWGNLYGGPHGPNGFIDFFEATAPWAVRVTVDAKRWTSDQMIEFFVSKINLC